MKLDDLPHIRHLVNEYMQFNDFLENYSKIDYNTELDNNSNYIMFINVPLRVKDVDEETFNKLKSLHMEATEKYFDSIKKQLISYGIEL